MLCNIIIITMTAREGIEEEEGITSRIVIAGRRIVCFQEVVVVVDEVEVEEECVNQRENIRNVNKGVLNKNHTAMVMVIVNHVKSVRTYSISMTIKDMIIMHHRVIRGIEITERLIKSMNVIDVIIDDDRHGRRGE